MSLKLQKILLHLARFVLGATFVCSGFLKAVDPAGFGYKVAQYLAAVGVSCPDWLDVNTIIAFSLAGVEFVLGVYLVLGIRRRLATFLTVVFMTIFTIISVLLVIYNPVADCGCFGDAVYLSNPLTLAKNVVLLALALFLARNPREADPFVPFGWQWFISLYSCVFIFIFLLRSLLFLPLIDFRPYHVGADLREAVFPQEIDEETVPLDFFVTDSLGEDMTAEILAEKGPSMLVICPSLKDAKTSVSEELNAIYDWCQDNGYPFYCLTSSSKEEIENWRYYNDASYPFLEADHTMLKTIVRSNPGLLLLRDGVLRNKWGANNLPQISGPETKVSELEAQASNSGRILLRILLWYLGPMLLMIFLSNFIQFIRKRIYRYRNKTKTLNPIKQSKTMRKKIVAGNWKMNMTLQEGVALAKELNEALAQDKPNCGVIICTPFIHLATVAPMLDTEVIKLGAENCADKEKGAYTGEVSAAMVKSTGAEYVILGHSERRAYYGETPEILKEKVNLALANNLKVIFCIGEVLEEREAGKQNEVVAAQLAGSLYDLTPEQFSNIILAYEPVWAIGTGKTATADQAQEMHAFIRAEIAKQFGQEVAENTTIQYGGSCKPSNAKELFAKPDVDGGLIGGAALKAADFKGIIDAWKA